MNRETEIKFQAAIDGKHTKSGTVYQSEFSPSAPHGQGE